MINLITLIIAVLCLAIFISIIRFITTDDIYTKILTVNLIGTKIILLVLLFGALSVKKDFTDIAMIYALINFISTIVILKYYEDKEEYKWI